jgi:ABC-type Fe3+ transport system permease subunit/sugar lactone lactonase YvrE
MTARSGSRRYDLIAGAPLVAFLLVCCLPVVGWLIVQILSHPRSLASVIAAKSSILLATLLYNLAAALVACVLASPVAMVIGRGRTVIVVPLLFICAVALLQPSVVYSYAWRELLYMLDLSFAPASVGDVLRCIFTIAGWLWPIPAIIVGLALRRMDIQLQQQALLDGALARITGRHLLPAILGGLAIVLILAMQEFSIYEATGMRVVATEVRIVFQSAWDISEGSAEAMATALPIIVLVLCVAAYVGKLARDASAIDQIDLGQWPRSLSAGAVSHLLALLVIAVTLAVPLAALLLSLTHPYDMPMLIKTYGPNLAGSMFYAAVVGALAMLIAVSGTVVRFRGAIALSVLTFLIGGQLVAIALIRLYNRPWLDWIYDGWPIAVLAELALFGWLAVIGGRLTWSRPWEQLREMSRADGATALQAAREVILPIAWPLCAAAAVLVGVLTLTEVPAMVLLQPQRPPALVPWLVTWVHQQRSDVMIQGSLLLLAMVMGLSAIVLLLAWLATRRLDRHRARRQRMRDEAVATVRNLSVALVAMLLLAGCGGGGARPDAIWCETGTGKGQVVYPRAIAYSPSDNTFFICDRLARIQQLDARGQFIREWRMPEWDTGKPVGLTVGPDGNLWVPDTHYHRVIVYTPDGREIRRFGSFGKEPGQFVLPTDIAFDSDGLVYISEYGDNDRIQVFDQEGRILRQIGRFGPGDGEFSRPQGIAIVGDLLYVTDSCNHRINVFKTDGTFVRNFGTVGSELGQFRFPYGIDVDPKGRLVICEFGNNRIQLVDPQTGRGLAQWGGGGREPGQLAYPWAVAVDRDSRVVAVDAGNNRLQVFTF